jgi:hypothetical protein
VVPALLSLTLLSSFVSVSVSVSLSFFSVFASSIFVSITLSLCEMETHLTISSSERTNARCASRSAGGGSAENWKIGSVSGSRSVRSVCDEEDVVDEEEVDESESDDDDDDKSWASSRSSSTFSVSSCFASPFFVGRWWRRWRKVLSLLPLAVAVLVAVAEVLAVALSSSVRAFRERCCRFRSAVVLLAGRREEEEGEVEGEERSCTIEKVGHSSSSLSSIESNEMSLFEFPSQSVNLRQRPLFFLQKKSEL